MCKKTDKYYKKKDINLFSHYSQKKTNWWGEKGEKGKKTYKGEKIKNDLAFLKFPGGGGIKKNAPQ